MNLKYILTDHKNIQMATICIIGRGDRDMKYPFDGVICLSDSDAPSCFDLQKTGVKPFRMDACYKIIPCLGFHQLSAGVV